MAGFAFNETIDVGQGRRKNLGVCVAQDGVAAHVEPTSSRRQGSILKGFRNFSSPLLFLGFGVAWNGYFASLTLAMTFVGVVLADADGIAAAGLPSGAGGRGAMAHPANRGDLGVGLSAGGGSESEGDGGGDSEVIHG